MFNCTTMSICCQDYNNKTGFCRSSNKCFKIHSWYSEKPFIFLLKNPNNGRYYSKKNQYIYCVKRLNFFIKELRKNQKLLVKDPAAAIFGLFSVGENFLKLALNIKPEFIVNISKVIILSSYCIDRKLREIGDHLESVRETRNKIGHKGIEFIKIKDKDLLYTAYKCNKLIEDCIEYYKENLYECFVIGGLEEFEHFKFTTYAGNYEKIKLLMKTIEDINKRCDPNKPYLNELVESFGKNYTFSVEELHSTIVSDRSIHSGLDFYCICGNLIVKGEYISNITKNRVWINEIDYNNYKDYIHVEEIEGSDWINYYKKTIGESNRCRNVKCRVCNSSLGYIYFSKVEEQIKGCKCYIKLTYINENNGTNYMFIMKQPSGKTGIADKDQSGPYSRNGEEFSAEKIEEDMKLIDKDKRLKAFFREKFANNNDDKKEYIMKLIKYNGIDIGERRRIVKDQENFEKCKDYLRVAIKQKEQYFSNEEEEDEGESEDDENVNNRIEVRIYAFKFEEK